MVEDVLVLAAREARLAAFAPYSKFRVGAALECADGTIITGCNVESASYGLTMCAERVAIFKAISMGIAPRTFRRVAVCADTETATPPCGACRQVMWEFCGDVPVVLCNLHGLRRELSLRELIPEAFDGSLLT